MPISDRAKAMSAKKRGRGCCCASFRGGCSAPLGGGPGSPSNTMSLGPRPTSLYQVVPDPSSLLATTDMGRKVEPSTVEGCCAPGRGGTGFQPKTMWPGPRPTSVTISDILTHPTVWPQCANVTDRQDNHESQTVP